MAEQDIFSFADELLASERDDEIFDFADKLIPEQRKGVIDKWGETLTHARSELERSPLPGFKAYAIQAGAGIVSPAARLIGKVTRQPSLEEYADRMVRFANAVEQVAREREEGGIVPDILKRGARGAAVSLTTMVPAVAIAGPYGAIAAASGQEANRAITEGKDAGKKGRELARYAVSQGVIEGIPATVMQKIGLGGVETLVSKRAVSVGLLQGLKRLGISAAQELPEEIITELGHNIAAKVSSVDPDALDIENLRRTVEDTTVQTLLTVGFAGAPGIARSVEAGRVAQITEETQTYARENKVPSRKTWRQWGLAPELGESRNQRRAFIRELAEQLEAIKPPVGMKPELAEPPAVSLEAPETAIVEPTAVAEAPVTPEVPEVAIEPEAVQEEAGPPVPEDQTVALNKASGAQIRESLDLPSLGEEAVQTFDSVMDRVAVDKADEKSLDMAGEVLKSRRQISAYEHVSMVLKATKLLNELDIARRNRARAASESNFTAHGQATIQTETITGQLDLLTAAARYSRREIARALSIGRLRLSRENFDIVNVLQEFQAAKGPRGKTTKEELKSLERLTDEQVVLAEKVEQEEERDRIEEEGQEENLAQKILTVNKPRKKISRSIQEKAIAERENIKKRIRQLGLRVNDITGVSVEGLYLIGRLGITYIKEGVGTLIGVAERLRADLPDLNLSDMDVNKALISRSPKERARAKLEGVRRVARLTSMARMLVEIDSLSHGIGVAAKKKGPVREDTRRLQKLLERARKIFYKSKMADVKLERAIETVNRLQDQLANGLVNIKKAPGEVSLELANVREQAVELRMELRVDEELKEVNKQLETGEYAIPIKQKKRPVNRRLERKQIELARKRKEIRQMIADAAPWGTRRVLKEIAAVTVAMKATADISFTMRQMGWQVFSHPIRTSKAFIPALEAFFSEYKTDQINNALLRSENAFLYEQSGLAILDASSPDAQQRSEVYRRNVIERTKIFGAQNPFSIIMQAAGRHAVAVGNLIRTSAFDHFMEKNPNATQLEMRAMADYINVSTGIGNLGRAGAIAEELQLIFFSPKFAASRVQTPWALKKYWELPRVRKQIARDMAGVISTGGMILMLAKLAGFEVSLFDPDDPDWGKIRIGNIRIDIWEGFQQPARVVARLAIAPFKADVEFNPLEILGRFAAFKLSPVVTVPVELIRGETAVGEERTVIETLIRTTMPMVLEDIEDAWKEEGVIGGIGVGALVIPGVSVSTYKDSQTATRKRIKKLRQAGEYAEAEWIRTMWNYENPKGRIITVK